VRRRGRVLLVQRPERARWGRLWEFPHAPLEAGEEHAAAARRILRDLTGIAADIGQQLVVIRHVVTRFRITLVCFRRVFRRSDFRSDFYSQATWERAARLGQYPVSTPQRRLARLLQTVR